ncbi:hypothetical protein [Reichenbachiella sp.]|uniref:hypothetical protein n=1 Tax=Reichenbachiella sp. TaxID=2184521 RepID=UPI003BB157DE
MKSAAFILSFVFVFMSCKEEEDQATYSCESVALNNSLSYSDLIDAVPDEVLTGFVEEPDEEGALGRNKNGYAHARFQLAATHLANYAVHFESEEALSEWVKSINYSFLYQTEAGDFEFIAPPDAPADRQPLPADLASGSFFFAYGLGISLHAFESSEWYQGLPDDHASKQTIEGLQTNIESLLTYLKSNLELIQEYDRASPNRLLFDGLAFYTLGAYLEDANAQQTGLGLAGHAMTLREQTAGYFIEAQGWDSSYNGVALKLGFELYALLGSGVELHNVLNDGLSCSADWQFSRVLESGEISTEGNTRVYPGGESLGGREKKVDVEKTVYAFYYMAALTNDQSYAELSQQVLEYYAP